MKQGAISWSVRTWNSVTGLSVEQGLGGTHPLDATEEMLPHPLSKEEIQTNERGGYHISGESMLLRQRIEYHFCRQRYSKRISKEAFRKGLRF